MDEKVIHKNLEYHFFRNMFLKMTWETSSICPLMKCQSFRIKSDIIIIDSFFLDYGNAKSELQCCWRNIKATTSTIVEENSLSSFVTAFGAM